MVGRGGNLKGEQEEEGIAGERGSVGEGGKGRK